MGFKHPKAQYFINKGLFEGIEKFSDLEDKISALPEKERGDAFEVFAEAYFATQSIHQAQEVLPEKKLSENVRDELGISFDAGVDGVIKTHLGKYQGYQVKFRTNRSILTWGSDGLSKFFGQTDACDERILFTNSIDLTDIAKERKNFISVRGNDLDQLKEEDFQKIQDWFKSGIVIQKKYEPKKHQKEAVDAIVETFKKVDRAQVIMACGTGKTLVALWAAEKLQSKNILILLPSLALVRQVLYQWARQNSWGALFSYLVVCSDKTTTRGLDEIILKQSDLDFSVTTDFNEVQKYLQSADLSQKIVFSTYQSCHVVAQAMPKNFVFDVAIFDEAHKTASRTKTNHAFALKDENIKISKRLFLTATPRHFNINKKDKEGDNRLVFSMDDESVYGPKAYVLSFKSAIAQGLICNYKIIVSMITSQEIDISRSLLKKANAVIGGNEIATEKIAYILALQRAVAMHDIHHIFSFHNSVESAEAFVNPDEGISDYFPEFKSMHVSGVMSVSKRDGRIAEFKQCEKAILSNARCLTEGVDVPAVDMVAFMSPKKSTVDIVQAAGRSMRLNLDVSKKKDCGYIFLPIFVQLHENETLESALDKTNYETIWDILNAMVEEDETLAEIINQMREEKGRGIRFSDSQLREKIEVLGPKLELDVLRKAIMVKIVEKLGSNWDERFGELQKFKEQYGHSNVSDQYNKELTTWIEKQRNKKRTNQLSQGQINKLNSIGFQWDPKKENWNEQYGELCKFKEQYGHCNVTEQYNKMLATWIEKQRYKKRINQLSQDKINMLDAIDFNWNPRDELDKVWFEYYNKLKQFKERYGHCHVNELYDKELASWRHEQRREKRKNQLRQERIDLLNSIGFDWNLKIIDKVWFENFNKLKQFKNQYDHCNVSARYDKKLARWSQRQRKIRKVNKLEQDRIDMLDTIGFDWNLKKKLKEVWQQRFEELKQFKKEFGHCNVPNNYPKNYRLGKWVDKQRTRKRKNRLEQDRIDMLICIGFVWDFKD